MYAMYGSAKFSTLLPSEGSIHSPIIPYPLVNESVFWAMHIYDFDHHYKIDRQSSSQD